MNVAGKSMRTIWLAPDTRHDCPAVEIIDQTRLPHELVIARLTRLDDAARAIRDMQVRGAPLIGAMAAYGMALAVAEDPSDNAVEHAASILHATRPTAVNLAWALAEMRRALADLPLQLRLTAALDRAAAIAEEDVAINRAIGEHGLTPIWAAFMAKPGVAPVQILTHCNAGWLATVDWGTALAPVYRAHDAGIPLHVWVDETRPRNQGASLTAWELGQHGVPHTVIADNAGGHLMRQGRVDLCIVGTDRTTASGDVANKIGTYLKALAAHDNGVPFYVALPSPTIDWTIADGADIPIEERDPREVTHIAGWTASGERVEVRLTPSNSPAANFAFDVTPARLVTALITERGICPASRDGLLGLFPERRRRGAA
ncbi:MAG TPA: S-methyl-5-thioribose-1-phosphate isomerase [Stellaceae bacterium]|nr:S-methyl-5-thioribose-1-phosphate isomerase [Stellaceae bacterium]